jgi:hypothetical protein
MDGQYCLGHSHFTESTKHKFLRSTYNCIKYDYCVGSTNPTADSLIILLERSGLYKPGARLQTRLNAAR